MFGFPSGGIPEERTHIFPPTLPLPMNPSVKTIRFILAGSILAALHAHAAVIDWKPASGDAVWATGTNWIGDTAPADDLTTDLARFNQTSYAFQPNAGTRSITGLEIGDGVTATAALTLSGTALSLGASGITMFANAGAATITSPLVIAAAQMWTNNSGSLLTVGTGVTTISNLLTLGGSGTMAINGANTGTGGVTISGGTIQAGNNAAFGAAGGTLTLSGGTLSHTTNNTARTIASNLSITASATLNMTASSGTTNLTFTGATQSITNAPTIALTSGSSSATFSFTTNPLLLGSGVTFDGSGMGALTGLTMSGGLTVGGAVASTNRTLTFNTTTHTATVSGALAGTAAGQTITLAGAGTGVVVGNITSGANTPGLIVNGAAAGVFTFTTANTFNGGVTVSGGLAEIQNDTGFGTNTLTLSGGSLRPGSGGDRTLANAVTINGPITFASSTASARFLTLSGNVNIASTPTITFSNSNVTAFTTGTTTLSTDATFQGAGNFQFRNGLTFSANRVLTINSTGAGALRGALAGGANTLTLSGNGSNFSVGDGTAVTGTTGGIIVNGPTVSFATSTSAFTGGVTATGGITRIGGDTVVTAGAIVTGPLGMGTFTANGGTITPNNTGTTPRITANNLAITGDSTFGVIGDANNTAPLTFNPTLVTSPSAGTITLTGARTEIFNIATTFTGPISGSGGQSLTVKGLNALTLTNATATASTFGNVTIGETVTSGSLGGRVNPGSQNALGAGSYAINYGGTLNPTANFSPANVITISNGGTYNPTGATGGITAFAATSAIASGGTLNNSSGQTLTITTANVSLPAAGVLLNNSAAAVTVTGAYPAFTGTVAFGGAGAGSITTSAATTTTGAQTLAFNQTGGGGMNLNGLTLGGSLTIAGTGNIGLSNSTIAQSSNSLPGLLGTVGESGSRTLTVSMAPTGLVSLANLSTISGGLTINGGVLSVNRAGSSSNTTTKAFTNVGVIALNGGVFRAANDANGTQAAADNFSIGVNGGTLEAMQTNNGPREQTFSGALTGSGPLTLRYGGTGASNSAPLVLAPTGASAYSGAVTLATSNGRGRVQFNANSLAGLSAGAVTVPGGTAFGVDAIGTLTGNLTKFTLNTDSILALNNISGVGSALDLSLATGLNRDIRLGGTTTYSGSVTLTPFGTTYNFTPDGGNITVNVTNLLTGSRNLDVRAGVIAPGAYGVAAGTMSINNAQDYTGSTTVAGTILNSAIGSNTIGTAGSTLNISGNFSAAGATSVTRGSALSLLAANGQLSGTSGVTVQGGATLTDGDGTAASNNGVANRINSAATLTLGGSDGGATLRMAFPAATFTHGQTLASLTVNSGSNTLNTTNTSAGTLNLTLTGTGGGAGYDRAPGGVVSVDSQLVSAASGGTITPTNGTGVITFSIGVPAGIKVGARFLGSGSGLNGSTIYVTEIISGTQLRLSSNANAATVITGTYSSFDSSLTNFNAQYTNAPTSGGGSEVAGGLLAGAFLNNTDFAVAGAAANLTAPAYTLQSAVGAWAASQHLANAANTAFAGTLAGGGLTINSLRSYMGGTVTIGAADTLTVASGMILHTSSAGLTFTAGNLTSGNTQDLLFNVQQNTVTVNSAITGGLALSKSGGGTLTLGSTGNAIGDVYALGGTTIINAAGALNPATTRTINLLGGSVQFAAGGAFAATGLSVGAAGGSLNTNANGALSFAGNVTLNGALGLGSPGGGNPTTLTFSGNLTGAGMVGIGKQSDGKNTVIFTGSNSNWSGGVLFLSAFANSASGNTHLRFSPSVAGYNSAGTGPIILTSGNTPGGLYFDTTAAGSTAFANDLVNNLGNVPLVAWGLSTGLGTVGTTNTTTLSGKLVGSQGLLLQGYATSDSAISELVLSGTVSVSGAAGGYSYGSATAAQNFNNGQGGITSGVTSFRTVTLQGTGNVPLVDLPVGTASNGAEGFVRFAGAQSFIPGAVGPGYISALRKAGAGNDGRFGYLLTGGGTYALPEGKSFVLGSLGTGAQVGGTLGAAGGGTATLTGSPKLAGFPAGDVNIHANAAADAQTLSVFARAAADTLVLGSIGNPVVFTPTYGDSGTTSAMTLLADRTGTTVLTKRGLGEVALDAVQYRRLDGVTSAAASFSWTIAEGTLTSPDAPSLAASLTFTGGTLKAAGAFNYANPVTLSTAGTVDTNGNAVTLSGPIGGATGTLTKTGGGALTLSGAQTYAILNANGGTTNVNSALGTGTSTINANANVNIYASQTLAALNIADGVEVTFGDGLPFAGGSEKAAAFGGVTVVPEPGSLASLSLGLGLLLGLRRRR